MGQVKMRSNLNAQKRFPSPVGSRTLRGPSASNVAASSQQRACGTSFRCPANPHRSQLPAEGVLHRVPTPRSPTFLVAFGFRHRAATTCGGRRGRLLGPRRRGGLWDGPRELPSGVPDKTCAAALRRPPPAFSSTFPGGLSARLGATES